MTYSNTWQCLVIWGELMVLPVNDFYKKLEYSKGKSQQRDIELLRNYIVGCVDVRVTTLKEDMNGVDYIVKLREGAEIRVDAKTREKGASKHWKHGQPELALELFSKNPTKDGDDGIIGWVMNEQKEIDLILYTFHESDSKLCFLIPFQHLRMALWKYGDEWKKKYVIKPQKNKNGNQYWNASCIFIPYKEVLKAICGVSVFRGVEECQEKI
jgi:hypothetical protein